MDTKRISELIDKALPGLFVPRTVTPVRGPVLRQPAFVANGVQSTVVVPGDWPENQERWFAKGDLPARPNSSMRALIDGEETYRCMADAIAKAEAGHFIILVGWSLDVSFPLDGKSGSTLLDLLKAAYDRGVIIRVLVWDNLSPSHHTRLHASAKQFEEAFHPHGVAVSGHRDDQALFFVDNNTRSVLGSHHQKILLVYGKFHGPNESSSLAGFFGGVDFAADRVQGAEKGEPQHDVHAVATGEAARDLYEIARARFQWGDRKVAAIYGPMGSPLIGPPDVYKPPTSLTGQAAFDFFPALPEPPLRRNSDRPVTLRFATTVGTPKLPATSDAWPQIQHAIQKATRFIYLQDQYLWSLDAANALVAALKRCTDASGACSLHVIILVPSPKLSTQPWLRRRFTNLLVQALSPAQLNNVSICRPKTAGDAFEKLGETAFCYVHSKIWIFDDELAIIGSANCNNRGYLYDSEVIGACADSNWNNSTYGWPWYSLRLNLAHRLRMDLWGWHLALSEDQVHDPIASALYWRHNRLAGRVAPLMETGAYWYEHQTTINPRRNLADPVPELPDDIPSQGDFPKPQEGWAGINELPGDPTENFLAAFEFPEGDSDLSTGTNSTSTTVATISTVVAGGASPSRVEISDLPNEVFPIPRVNWPAKAHAPNVLSFTTGATFRSLSPALRRETFVKIAINLLRLGKGSKIVTATGSVVDYDRPVGYADAIAMGESAQIRGGLVFTSSERASSCGMFVRSMFKMIGVQHASYAKPYIWGNVISVEHDIAAKCGALVHPGDKDGDGNKRIPQLGDCVYVLEPRNDKKIVQHFFVITGMPDLGTVPPVYAYNTAQGGAGSTKEFPDDGSCMAIQDGVIKLSTADWMVGRKRVQWWIDIAAMAGACDTDPIIEPDPLLRRWWLPSVSPSGAGHTDLDGDWFSVSTLDPSKEPTKLRLKITTEDSDLSGEYQSIDGGLLGTFRGSGIAPSGGFALSGTWASLDGNRSGTLTFNFSHDRRSFLGTWQTADGSESGDWVGTR